MIKFYFVLVALLYIPGVSTYRRSQSNEEEEEQEERRSRRRPRPFDRERRMPRPFPYHEREKDLRCYTRFDYEYKVLEKLLFLEQRQRDLKQTIQSFNETVVLQKKVINKQKEAIEALSHVIIKLQSNDQLQDNSLDKLKKYDQIAGEKLVSLERKAGTSVAFSAYLDETRTFANEAIAFNRVLINEPANVFSQTTGTFICPVSGIYMFSFVVATRSFQGPSEVFAELKVNNRTVIQAVSESRNEADDVQGNNMAVVKLIADDRVWVSAEGTTTGSTWGRPRTRTSSFAGFLIRATK